MVATGFVVLAALLVAVWAAPRASGAAAAWIHTPPVHLSTLRPDDGRLPVTRPSARGAGEQVVLDAGAGFSMAGVTCDVPSSDGVVTLRLRTSLDSRAWGPWLEAPLELAGEDTEATAYIDAVWTGPARYVQVEALAVDGGAPAALTGVRLVAIDPSEDGSVAARLTGAVRKVAAAVAGVSFAAPASAATTQPAIVTRAQWGADEKLRKEAPSYATVKMAFVHHTAGANDYSAGDAPALVRGIYAYHTKSLGWNDIGYNFLIDRFGTIYEGRYGGSTKGVVGAHVYGFNTGSTGVSVMGTFTNAAPPAAARSSLERLLAWKLGLHSLAANATAKLTCGGKDKYAKGATVTFPVISGHRDANYTECPGSTFYALLPSIRSAVVKRMASAIVAKVTPSTALVSPNGDGVLDTTVLTLSLKPAASWQLTIRNAGGTAVASWSGEGASAVVTWGGTSGGSKVADGVYTAELRADPGGENEATTAVAITVDTVAPRLTKASVSTSWFSPNGDGQTDTATVTYAPAELCTVRVGIVNEGGEVLRWLHGWQTKEARSYSVKWDGRIGSSAKLVAAPDGDYRFRIERRDAAGNTARQGVNVAVDRTIGSITANPAVFSPNEDGAVDRAKLTFTLTRQATVTVRYLVGADVVRTVELGTRAKGKQTTTWNGKAGSGEYLASSRPVCVITAVSAVGESSVSKALVVDLSRPRIYATVGKAVAVKKSVKLGFKVSDSFSTKVKVSYMITDAKGRRVLSRSAGWQPVGKALTITWKPASRGKFTVTYKAVDQAGNPQAATARTAVTVR